MYLSVTLSVRCRIRSHLTYRPSLTTLLANDVSTERLRITCILGKTNPHHTNLGPFATVLDQGRRASLRITTPTILQATLEALTKDRGSRKLRNHGRIQLTRGWLIATLERES
jgi:hypothetical protein